MNRKQKFFGMTRLQMGVLAGLAGTLVLILCAGAFLVFRNSTPSLSASQPTSTPLPTVTLAAVLPPTVTPTSAPTAIPYEQLLPAGWKQFKTALVEIWLPSNFKLGDTKALKQTLQLGTNELIVTEISSKTSAYAMRVSVSYDLLSSGSLDEFLQNKISQFPADVRVTDRRTVNVNTVEAQRLTIERRINNIDINDMVYVFLDGSTIWYVEYTAQITQFFENLAVFEQSIKTFRPVRY